MSLLKLSTIQDSEWYLSEFYSPYGKKSNATKRFSPREKTIRKCKEVAFYMTELPVIQHYKYNMWKYFDKIYVYWTKLPYTLQNYCILYKISIY